MPEESNDQNLRDKLQREGEDAIGKLAEGLLEHPFVKGAISGVVEARGAAVQAQELALEALNIPSAADIERLTRRLRSVSQRLEGIEDGVDRLDDRLGKLSSSSALDTRMQAIEDKLDALADAIAKLDKPPARKPAARKPAAKKPAA